MKIYPPSVKQIDPSSVQQVLLPIVDAQDKEGCTPLCLALVYDNKKVVESLLKRGVNPNLANSKGLTPLHICLRKKDGDLLKIFFKINDELNQQVLVDARDELGLTPLQWAVENLRPNTVDILLDHGADLSSIVFPTPSAFAWRWRMCYSGNFKLRLVSDLLAIVDSLEKNGYEFNRSDSLKIMRLFDYYFEKWVGIDDAKEEDEEDDEEGDDEEEEEGEEEEEEEEEEEMIMIPSLSLYDQLIQLRPEEAVKQLTYMDYFEFARSVKLCKLPKKYREACTLRLCEKLSRRFYRRWALDSFLELTRHRLPILCCEMIIEKLKNEDLYHICLAASGKIVW
ncbi:hypothetical protein TKK_0013618 [Trichogramma kaykai]